MAARCDDRSPLGIKKISDAVYCLHEPEGFPEKPPTVEIVFIHGLQLSGLGDAFWETWIVGSKDGRDLPTVNVWPMTWLAREIPGARILSLSYDSSAFKNANQGRMDIYALGENLVKEMVEFAEIGQFDCPVVFVCHSLGGLVVKDIVLKAEHKFSRKQPFVNFLQRIRGFLFYATPHLGSKLADLVSIVPCLKKSALVPFLKVLNNDIGRLNQEFDDLIQDKNLGDVWQFAVVAELHETKYGVFKALVVNETSARHCYRDFFCVGTDHFGVCKPTSESSTSFVVLKNFLKRILELSEKRELLPFQHPVVGMSNNQKTLLQNLTLHRLVGVVGMSGIGKTTLCMSVYNLQRRNYGRSCYLQDINSRSPEDVLRELYINLFPGRKLAQAFSTDVSHLQRMIGDCVRKCKVLIVYDNVWSDSKSRRVLQIEAFSEGSGMSRAILVSQNRQDFKDYHHIEIMDAKCLDQEAAFKLFDFHAFRNRANDDSKDGHDPPFVGCGEEDHNELIQIREAIVTACGGLPLSLEVIGSLLGVEKTVELQFWEEALEKLRLAESHTGGTDNGVLWKGLEIAYINLNDREKVLFLDLATFHNHFKVPYRFVVGMYEFGEVTFRHLVERCLVRIKDESSEENQRMVECPMHWYPYRSSVERVVERTPGFRIEYVVHEQLRDLGRRLARDKGKESSARLAEAGAVCTERTLEFDLAKKSDLTSFMETKVFVNLECLMLRGTRNMCVPHLTLPFFISKKDSKFSSLRILSITEKIPCHYQYDVDRVEDLIESVSEMFAYVKSCTTDVVCILFGAKREPHNEDGGSRDGGDGLVNAHPHRLRARRRQMKLIYRMDRLMASFCRADNFVLSLVLEKLPVMTKLEVLTVAQCSNTSLPADFKACTKLRYLCIQECGFMTGLPSFLGTSVKLLEHISILSCPQLKNVPETVGNLTNLKYLHIWECEKLEELPLKLDDLPKLILIWVGKCRSLRHVCEFTLNAKKPNFTFKNLVINDCPKLMLSPGSLSNLRGLETLSINRCRRIDVDSLVVDRSYRNLKTVMLGGNLGKGHELTNSGEYSLSANPSSVDSLPTEQVITTLGFIWRSEKLEFLCLRNYSLKNVDFRNVSQIQILRLLHCSDLHKLLVCIGHTALQLKELELRIRGGLTNLPEEIGELSKLLVLALKCNRLKTLPTSLGKLSRLSRLDLRGCKELSWKEPSQLSLLEEIREFCSQIILPNGLLFLSGTVPEERPAERRPVPSPLDTPHWNPNLEETHGYISDAADHDESDSDWESYDVDDESNAGDSENYSLPHRDDNLLLDLFLDYTGGIIYVVLALLLVVALYLIFLLFSKIFSG